MWKTAILMPQSIKSQDLIIALQDLALSIKIV